MFLSTDYTSLYDRSDELNERALKASESLYSLMQARDRSLQEAVANAEAVADSILNHVARTTANLPLDQDRAKLLEPHINKILEWFHTSSPSDEARKELEKLNEESIEPADLTVLWEGDKPLEADLFPGMFEPVVDSLELLDESYADLRCAVFLGGYACSILESYQQLSDLDKTPHETLVSLLSREATDLCESLELAILKGFKTLYDFLKNESPLSELPLVARGVYQSVGYKVASYGSSLGQLQAAADMQSETVEMMPLLRLSQRFRDLVLQAGILVAYGAFLEVSAHLPTAKRWYTHEKKRTRRNFDSVRPLGEPVSIAKALSPEISTDATKLLQIEGIVKNLRIEDDPSPPKFSTFLEIEDASGNEILVRAHQFSLENNGLTNATFAVINGYLVDHDNSTRRIDIDRVSLSKQRKQSWLDDVIYRMRFAHLLFPDEMNMSISPGLKNVL